MEKLGVPKPTGISRDDGAACVRREFLKSLQHLDAGHSRQLQVNKCDRKKFIQRATLRTPARPGVDGEVPDPIEFPFNEFIVILVIFYDEDASFDWFSSCYPTNKLAEPRQEFEC